MAGLTAFREQVGHVIESLTVALLNCERHEHAGVLQVLHQAAPFGIGVTTGILRAAAFHRQQRRRGNDIDSRKTRRRPVLVIQRRRRCGVMEDLAGRPVGDPGHQPLIGYEQGDVVFPCVGVRAYPKRLTNRRLCGRTAIAGGCQQESRQACEDGFHAHAKTMLRCRARALI